jgi:hypothetical protein
VTGQPGDGPVQHPLNTSAVSPEGYPMTMKTKILILALSVAALLQAGFLLHVKATLDGTRKTVALMRENIELNKSYQALTERYQNKVNQLCALRVKMGNAYRVVLGNLVEDLGLDQRPTGVAMNFLSSLDLGVGGPGP